GEAGDDPDRLLAGADEAFDAARAGGRKRRGEGRNAGERKDLVASLGVVPPQRGDGAATVGQWRPAHRRALRPGGAGGHAAVVEEGHHRAVARRVEPLAGKRRPVPARLRDAAVEVLAGIVGAAVEEDLLAARARIGRRWWRRRGARRDLVVDDQRACAETRH